MTTKKQKFLINSIDPEELGAKNILGGFGNNATPAPGSKATTTAPQGNGGGGSDKKNDNKKDGADDKDSKPGDIKHVDVSQQKKIDQVTKEIEELQDEQAQLLTQGAGEILEKYSAGLGATLKPGERQQLVDKRIQAKIDSKNRILERLEAGDLDAALKLQEGENQRASTELQTQTQQITTKFQVREDFAKTRETNATNIVLKQIEAENATFQAKVKEVISVHDQILQGLNDKNQETGNFYLEDATFTYLQTLGIDKKITLDQSDKSLASNSTIKSVQQVTDYTQIKIDPVLLYERDGAKGGNESPLAPVSLYYIPDDVKITKLASVGLDAESAKETDFVHNIQNPIKVYKDESSGKYFYTDDKGEKKEAPEDQVYAKAKLKGSAQIAKSPANRKMVPQQVKSSELDENGQPKIVTIMVPEPLPEDGPTEKLESLYHKVSPATAENGAYQVLYKTMPPTEQKDFDVTFSFIKDLNQRKLITGIWSKRLDDMGLLGSILRTIMPYIGPTIGGWMGMGNKDSHSSANQPGDNLSPDAQVVKEVLKDGVVQANEKPLLASIDPVKGVKDLAASYVAKGGKLDQNTNAELADLGNNLKVDATAPNLTDINPHDYRQNSSLKAAEILLK